MVELTSLDYLVAYIVVGAGLLFVVALALTWVRLKIDERKVTK